MLESCNELSTKTFSIHISTCHLYLIDNKQYEKGQKTNSLNVGEFDSRWRSLSHSDVVKKGRNLDNSGEENGKGGVDKKG